MRKIWKRILASVLAFVLVFGMVPPVEIDLSGIGLPKFNLGDLNLGLDFSLPVYATNHTPLTGVTVSDSANSSSLSGSTVTITAKGSLFSEKTNTVTVTNASSSKATISFDYSASTYNNFTIAGASANASGTWSGTLDAGGTLTIVLKSNKGLSNTTATLTLSNWSCTAVADSSKVTFQYDSSLGTVKVGGSAVNNGDTVDFTSDGKEIVATPNSGVEFLGWVNTADNSIVSKDATYTLAPTGNMTVKAVFTTATAKAWWLVDDKYLTDDLNTACSLGTKVVLAANGTLPAKVDGTAYEIPSGVTLLIPFDSGNSIFEETPNCHKSSYTKPTLYRKLTMASGAHITVNGKLNVGGSQTSWQNGANDYNGNVSGPYGQIDMVSGSTITLANGSNLYAWGYITGAGTVTAQSGSTVYESFQLRDYRGGSMTSTTATDTNNKNTYHVFPMSQYFIQNIEVLLKIEAGATEKAYMAVEVDTKIFGIEQNGTPIPMIGNNDAMFTLKSGFITKDFDEKTGRLCFEINGEVSVSTITMSMQLSALTGTTTIDSSEFNLPIPGHMTVTALSGSDVTIAQDIALLPGSELYINEDATCTLGEGKRVIAYSWTDWTKGGYKYFNDSSTTLTDGYTPQFFIYSESKHKSLYYSPTTGGTVPVERREKDALICIDGIIDASAGAVYTTESGANIYSTGTGKVITTPGSELYTYQIIQTDVPYWAQIPIKPAALKNGGADGTTYTETANCATDAANPYGFEYDSQAGKWVCVGTVNSTTCMGHTAGTAATCTTAQTCTVCGTELTAALGHDEVSHKAKAPTCTEVGWDAYVTCSRCDYSTYVEKAALGHSYTSEVTTEPTCTEAGVRTDTCSACGDTYTEAIAATGHTAGADATCTTAQTCVVCGAELNAALDHNWNVNYKWADDYSACTATRTCSRSGCGSVETATATVTWEETKASECTSYGKRTYTAIFEESWAATQTKTDVSVDATGHTFEDIAAKEATCLAPGNRAYKYCTACELYFEADAEVNNANGKSDNSSFVIAQKQHSYTGDIKSDGNGKDATHSYKCVNGCNQYGGAVTHTWGEGVQTAAPGCESEGVKTYTCTVDGCGATYTEAISATGHNYGTEWKSDATNHWHECACGEKSDVGTHSDVDTDGDHNCDVCGKALTTVHTYTLDTTKGVNGYEWSADGGSCTAYGKCNCGQTTTATATITSEVVKAATCTENGDTKYTATFTETWAETQTKVVTDIDAKDHAWSVEYNFAEDGSSCTATHVCGNDSAHNVTVEATITSEVTTQPTCTEKGQTTYTATFEETWAETQTKVVTDIDAIGHKDEGKDHVCDNGCGVYQGTHADSADDKDHVCDYGCGATLEACVDNDEDHKCDNSGCGATLSKCADENKDHYCDSEGCKAKLSECVDGNPKNHVCDYEGCKATMGTCEDKDLDHECDYGCDKTFGTCEDKDLDHDCDYGCSATFGEHKDENTDHACDYGCSVTIGTCEDKDQDHDCDYGCDKAYGTHEAAAGKHTCDYCGQTVTACKDNLTETDKLEAKCEVAGHKAYWTCSVCGKYYSNSVATAEIADLTTWLAEGGEGYIAPLGHVDENTDHKCDNGCDVYQGTHEDGDDDNHLCDYGCGEQADDGCHDADNDGDHTCDECTSIVPVNTCGDAGKDHTCDTDSKCTAYNSGTNACRDDDFDHACDYKGCTKIYGTCEDTDKNHKCDYGEKGTPGVACGQTFGTHADSADDKDHVCDYGCGVVLETCSDKTGDGNHKCDVCGTDGITDHTYSNATCEAPKTCSECGATTGEALGHIDENHDHICDRNCGKTDMGAHEDAGKDHKCDYGCSVAIGTCEDTDFDHACDYGCSKVYGKCEDGNENHYCDYGAGSANGCRVYFGTHTDIDNDHDCDYCGVMDYVAFGPCEDKDGDGDHVCDYGCGATLTTCGDEGKDHVCDTDSACDKYNSGDNACVDKDGDGDHVCDYGCKKTLSTCGDSDTNHVCDTDSKCTVYSTGDNACADADNDGNHLCDYGCGATKNTCGDSDTNHVCDTDSACTVYSTDENVCADKDGDGDHVCDYGCGAKLSNCADADNDGNHKCDECGADNVTEHSYDSVVTDPTCTAEGYTTHTCSECDDTYTDNVTEANGHSYDAVVTAPTCTVGGYTTHTCSVCKHSYTDANTAATGHSYGDVAFNWSADYKCTASRGCDNCDYSESVTADSTSAITTTATCTVKQVTTYTAEFTAEWILEANRIQTKDVEGATAPDNHTQKPTYTDKGDGTHTKKYPCCEKELVEGHTYTDGKCACENVQTFTITWVNGDITKTTTVNYGDVPVAPFEESDLTKASDIDYHYTFAGWGTVVAAYENATYTAVYSEAGHDYTSNCKVCSVCNYSGDGTRAHKVGNATCEHAAVCELCHMEVMPAIGHNYTYNAAESKWQKDDNGQWVYVYVATCATEANCEQKTYTETVTAQQLAQDQDTAYLAPTCTTAGQATFIASGFTATWAQDKQYSAVLELSALGHDLTETKAKAATCTETGTLGYWTCDRCSAVFEDAEATIHTSVEARKTNPLGHDWKCTADGTITCNRDGCDETTEEDIDSAHTWVSAGETPATCTTPGEHAGRTCSVCNKAEGGGTINPLGHRYGETKYEWEMNELGVWFCTATHTCTREGCVHSETDTATVTSVITTAPTCTVMGYTTYTATFGVEWAIAQVQTKQDVSLAAHTPDDGIITQSPFYNKDGVRTFYCTKCGAVTGTAVEPATGKIHISVLGDSITAFKDYSNGQAAVDANTTLSGGTSWFPMTERTYDSEGNPIELGTGEITAAEHIWIYKAAEQLGAKILVNNSWSGSAVNFWQYGCPAMWQDRVVQLHDNTGTNSGQEPDIIVVYMGTNDFKYTEKVAGTYAIIDKNGTEYQSVLGTYEEAIAKFNELVIDNGDGTFTYGTPANTMEAYVISFHKMQQRYPNSEIYVMTILPFRAGIHQPTDFNEDIRQMAAYFDVTVVDIEDTGIVSDENNFKYLMEDWLHPNLKGMEVLANAFESVVRNTSELYDEDNHVDVTYKDMTGVTSMEGTTRVAFTGESFDASLKLNDQSLVMQVKVLMDGVDITSSCVTVADDAKLGGKIVNIHIENVTGAIEITAKAHKHEYTGAVTAPTCTEGGYTTYTCACGDTYKANEVAATGHSYTVLSDTVATEATCTTDAYYFAKCANCSDVHTTQTLVKENTKLGHSYTNKPSESVASEATCTDPARHYVQCDRCDEVSTDKTVAVGEPLGHSYAAATYEWTYDAVNNAWICTAKHVCSRNSSHIETATATVTDEVTTDPTCTAKGWTTYTATFNVDWATKQSKDVENIDALGHDYGETTYEWTNGNINCTAKRECSRENCGYFETSAAYVESVVKTPATCTTKGWTKYSATFVVTWAAEQTTEAEDINALGHKWSVTYDFAEDGSACTATRTCANSTDCTETATATISSAVKTPATCEGKGTTTYTATFDEDWATTQTKDVVDIPAINHAWNETTYNFAESGKTCTATRTCANSTDCTETVTATISSAVKTPATCEGKGTTTYTATFTVSWATTQTKNVVDIPATGHDIATVAAKAATCTEIGWNAYEYCKREGCGHTTYSELEALGHSMTKTDAKDPTCTATGNNAYYTCGRCSGVFKDEAGENATTVAAETIAAIGHDYDDGVVTTDPTCTVNGVKTFTCQNDASHTYTESVASLGHNPEKVEAKAPTCTEEGYKEHYKCSRENCGVLFLDEAGTTTTVEAALVVNATGHTKETIPAVAPTCTETGLTEGTKCSVCNEVLKAQEVVDANGHSYSTEWTTDGTNHWHECHCGDKSEVAAHSDVTTKDHKCDTCGYVMSTCSDANDDGNHACDHCGKAGITTCGDAGKDHICDTDSACTAYNSGDNAHADSDKDHACDYGCTESIGTCEDADKDHDCDYGCSAIFGEHKDGNSDHACDYGCSVTIGTCADSAEDQDHVCDYGCGAVLEDCEDTDFDHACDNGCDKYFGEHKDDNADHVCDYGCSEKIGAHADSEGDGDHICDYCKSEEKLTECEDADTDHDCDECNAEMGTCEDTDKDHKCDYGCDKVYGEHKDENTDHTCDYGCKESIGTCVDADKNHKCDYGCNRYFGAHRDDDKDHACDYGCSVTIGTHGDANKDHACDYGCSESIGTCEDSNKDHACDHGCGQSYGTCEDTDFDHACDYGCDKVYGTHEDTDKDHACDYGCSESIGTCEDTDFDHACDYGCDLVYGTHVDTDKDHACDYGCTESIGTCEDKDFDHACDYGCDKVYGTHEDTDKDHACDYGCKETIGTCEDKDLDHACDYGCDHVYGTHEDTDKDHACDYGCTESIGTCEDADFDHACDYGCDKVYGTHEDTDKDHACDYGCSVAIGTCEDKNFDHACDYGCDKVYGTHEDTDKDHACDYGCKEAIGICEDEDFDHACDYGCSATFGEHKDGNSDHACDYGCSVTIGTCEDKDFDHACDYGCDKVYGTHEDTDKDHACDYGCKESIGTCEDKDFDHACDYGCEKVYGTHEDTDKDHACDYGCSESIGTCEDKDFDHACDYGCDLVYGTHEDTDKDHACDYGCTESIGTCEDEDFDHACDYGCDKVYGTHEDTDKDHACDYGCSESIGSCEDKDFDHACDYGCDKVYGTHEDTDKDHACDYGCKESIGICEDKDFDHICDYGCSATFGEHKDGNSDHACDYGCSESIGACEDKDFDHACDHGCGQSYGTCEDKNFDHACDYGCDQLFGEHADGDDSNHECDYCGKSVGETCYDADNDSDHTCDECGKENVTDHLPGDPVKENEVPATTVSSGSYELVSYCMECGEKLEHTTVTVETKLEIVESEDYVVPDQIQDIIDEIEKNETVQGDTAAEKLENIMVDSIVKDVIQDIVDNNDYVKIEDVVSELIDVVLQYTTDGGDTWIDADEEHFPEEGKILIVLPVPAGTNLARYSFFVAHMFSSNAFGGETGEIEYPEVEEFIGEDGMEYIRFYVTGLSPVVISYLETDPCADGHDWNNATCTDPKTCSVCGATEGETTDHKDEDNDHKCDYCGLPMMLKGDVDLDGDVDAEDLTLLARHVAGIELLSRQALANADVNSDGDVTAEDLTMLARYIAGIITDWETAPSVLKGDVDLDGDVDAEDLTILSRHIAGIELLTDAAALANADVNGDGNITADDLTLHARYVAGIITSWEDGE